MIEAPVAQASGASRKAALHEAEERPRADAALRESEERLPESGSEDSARSVPPGLARGRVTFATLGSSEAAAEPFGHRIFYLVSLDKSDDLLAF